MASLEPFYSNFPQSLTQTDGLAPARGHFNTRKQSVDPGNISTPFKGDLEMLRKKSPYCHDTGFFIIHGFGVHLLINEC